MTQSKLLEANQTGKYLRSEIGIGWQLSDTIDGQLGYTISGKTAEEFLNTYSTKLVYKDIGTKVYKLISKI